MIKKIAFIGHPVQDMKRARKFYGELLGLEKTAEYEDKWCEFDTPEGKTIALDSFSPEGTPPYLSLETDDIDEIVKSSKSMMPKALLDRFTKDEIFELLSYLESPTSAASDTN